MMTISEAQATQEILHELARRQNNDPEPPTDQIVAVGSYLAIRSQKVLGAGVR